VVSLVATLMATLFLTTNLMNLFWK